MAEHPVKATVTLADISENNVTTVRGSHSLVSTVRRHCQPKTISTVLNRCRRNWPQERCHRHIYSRSQMMCPLLAQRHVSVGYKKGSLLPTTRSVCVYSVGNTANTSVSMEAFLLFLSDSLGIRECLSETSKFHVGFQGFTAVTMTSSIFWDVTPCSPT